MPETRPFWFKLYLASKILGVGAVLNFDGLSGHRLPSLIPEGREPQAFAGEVLGAMSADTEEAAGLRHTLQPLLDTNYNFASSGRLPRTRCCAWTWRWHCG